MKCLEISNLTKRFGKQIILENVSFSFPKKGLFCIVGDSGSGKSTLFEILSGIDMEYTGDVLFYGKSFSKMKEDERSDFRLRNVGFIRQSYDLLELETVIENVSFPLSGLKVKKKLRDRKSLETLEYLGLKDKALNKVNTLSGGEKQRVAIARAISTDPKIILADEPTGALDKKNSAEVYRIFKNLSTKRLVIVVTHDIELAKEYADEIICLKNKTLFSEKNQNEAEEESSIISFEPPKKLIEGPSWSPLTWIRHAVHLFKAKKLRSSLTISIISFSLVALGASIYVQKDLKNELNTVFTSCSGSKGISMRSNNDSASTFGQIISANKKEIDSLIDKYDFIDEYGINYLCAYENYFKDLNEFYFDSFGSKAIIPSFSVRNINEYQWLDRLDEKTKIYPERPKVMENEHIVMSLPYASMVNMCLSLHINRSYQALGDYLKKKPLEIYMEMANNSWGYADRQMFVLLGIIEGNIPTIYHLRHDWNEYVFEDSMGFPTSNEDDSSLPWILRKTYYILPKDGRENFIKKARESELLDKYVFERDSYDYDQTHNERNKASSSERLYVYQADKESLKYKDINEIVNQYHFDFYSIFGESSYVSFSDGMVSGFACPFFLSDSKDEVITISESMTKRKKEEVYMNLSLPSNVSSGQYLMNKNSSLTISSDFSSLREGEMPTGCTQVCLSEKLYEKFNKSKTLFCEGVISNKEDGDFLESEFRLGKLEVTGIVEGNDETIYVTPTWSIDFFRDELGMSSFSLEPKKVVFYCDSSRSKNLIPILSNKYPSLKFSDPSMQIESSISDVIVYLGIVLESASIVSLTISAFLFLTNALLLSLENKKEAILLFELGVRRNSIFDSFITNVLISGTLSYLISFFALAVTEFTINKTLRDSFGTSSSYFKIDFYPMLIMLIFLIGATLLSSIYLNVWIKKSKFTREGNSS